MASVSTSFLLLLLLAATAFEVVAGDETTEGEVTGEGDGDGDSDNGDGDGDDNDDDLCGAGMDEGDGNGPSLEDYGILALAEAASDPRSLALGWRQYGDRLIFEKTVRRLKGFGLLHDEDVKMPRSNATITHVLARPAGDGGGALRAERRAGGVGQAWVHLKLRAPRGFGLHYEVRVYGR